jgi:toxin ParE1/3/4
VPEFRLSERAERDLVEIYDYTDQTFGAYQADAYHAGLERTFDLLANFPRIGLAVNEIAAGFRRFRFQAHLVFYTEEDDFILIRAVLHQAREIKPDLFD